MGQIEELIAQRNRAEQLCHKLAMAIRYQLRKGDCEEALALLPRCLASILHMLGRLGGEYD